MINTDETLKEIYKLRNEIDNLYAKINAIENEVKGKDVQTSICVGKSSKSLSLYIYADEALFEKDDFCLSLRSNAVEFLDWSKRHFNCIIISDNPLYLVRESFNNLYLSDWLNEIQILEKEDSTNVESIIDPYKDFYIVSTKALQGTVIQSTDLNNKKRYIKLNKQSLTQAQVKLFKCLLRVVNSKIESIIRNNPDNISVYSRLVEDEQFYKLFTYGKQYKKGYISLKIESSKYTLDTVFVLKQYYKECNSNTYTLFTTKGVEELVDKIHEIYKTVIPIMQTGNISGLVESIK